MQHVLAESETLSLNFVPAEVKARCDKFPWLKLDFHFAGILLMLRNEPLLTM